MDESRFHQHWYIHIHKQGRIYRFLRRPRWYSFDRTHVEASRFAWGVQTKPHGTFYTLSWLGVLHGLTGLTLIWDDE